MMLQWKGKPLDLLTRCQECRDEMEECYKLGLDKSDWDRVGKATNDHNCRFKTVHSENTGRLYLPWTCAAPRQNLARVFTQL